MIRIEVLSRQGTPLGQPLSALFGPEGGTIGRAGENILVLDDPDRTVSRVHAQVSYRDGRYFIADRGSNPLQCNGQALGEGRELELRGGERLAIGTFELEVQSVPETWGAAPEEMAAAGRVDDDPFAHLLDGLVPPSVPPPVAPAPMQKDPTAGLFPDPLAGTAPAAIGDDPFAGLLRPVSNPATTPPGTPVDASRKDDFSDLVSPVQGIGGESIDALFGLGAPLANDPLALSPLADPLAQPDSASAQDPLAALSRHTPLRHEVRSDHLPIDALGFIPPAVSAPAPGPTSKRPEADTQSDSLAVQPLAQQANRSAYVEAFVASVAPAPARESPAAAVPPGATRSVDEGELLAAFLRGLGPLQQPVSALTPELMERIGDLLRTATEGTLQLLLARQEIKREVRAEVTVIAAQANNPLKFSPTVEMALTHLLGPSIRGFMPAQAAMRDAYQDLRAHEFGVMVGMRAALEHVIRRFAPAEIEDRITARSRLDAIFSANRKARLWDRFVELYADIAREAEDDFHSLFGKAFLEAYEEQMARLKDGGRG